MLKLNTLFGFALGIAVTGIGVYAYDTHSAKTEPVGVVAKCFGQPRVGEVKCDPGPRVIEYLEKGRTPLTGDPKNV